MSAGHDPADAIGLVIHYFSHLSVAAVRLTAPLAVGDRIHIRGHTTDLVQDVASLEGDHAHVRSGHARWRCRVKVEDHAPEREPRAQLPRRLPAAIGRVPVALVGCCHWWHDSIVSTLARPRFPRWSGGEMAGTEVIGMVGKTRDRIVVESEKVGQPAREGEIIEIIEASYGTRYRVIWDDGHESTLGPTAGSAKVIPAPKRRSKE
jgi:hypothetical protein